MPKSTVSQSSPKASSTANGKSANDSGRKRNRSANRKQSASATNTILERLGQLDSRITDLAENKGEGITLKVSETLDSQAQAIVQVADALRSLECSLVTAVTDAIDHKLAEGSSVGNIEPIEAAVESSEETFEPTEPVAAPLSEKSWDDIRNACLESHGENVSDASGEEETSKRTELETFEEDASHVNEPESELEIPEFTSIGEPESLNAEELRTAVINQERTISMLVKRLQKRSRAAQRISQDQLADLSENSPEELQAAIGETLQLLRNQSRYGELELSLERARVSRQASQLEVASDRLHARARTMGLEIDENGEISQNASTKERGSKGRNWLGAMGFGS